MSTPMYAKGDRFEDADYRNEGRIIEVIAVLDDPSDRDAADYRAVVEVHPKNPSAVGHETVVSERTLSDRRRYRKISR